MRASYRLAGQFGVAALIAFVLGVVTAFIGAWTIGLPPETAHPMIPPAYRPAFFVFAFSGLLALMTVSVFIAAVVESWLSRDVRNAQQDTTPNSRPPLHLPSSPEVQSPDSQRTPSSGGCGQLLMVFSLICIYAFRVGGATPATLDSRDQQVLQSLLLHLAYDSKFDMRDIGTNHPAIVLDARTPAKIGFILSNQIRSDVGERHIPEDAEGDLQQRNWGSGTRDFNCVVAYYTNLTFSTDIVVTDLSKLRQRPAFDAFEKAYPGARGWVEAYLPGYSGTGTEAVVRALVGPWAHAATVTALLEKRGEKWVVKWYVITRYA